MQLEVNRDRCIGAGECVRVARRVFDQREEDGLVQLRSTQPQPSDTEAVRYAQDLCPTQAITIRE